MGSVRTVKAVSVALLVLAVLSSNSRAQSLPISLFERYLDSLRQQAGIPGLSGAIVQEGRVIWEGGFGYQDVASLTRATPDTPYPILDLSQTISSTLLLQQCFDQRYLELSDRVRRWIPGYPEQNTTVSDLLSHAGSDRGFRYDANRYANLTTVIEQCTSERYPVLLSEEILDRLAMRDTVPGHDLADGSLNRRFFSSDALDRYTSVLRRVAVPYKVDSRGQPSRSEYSRASLSASTGVVSTVRDLADFDINIGHLLATDTRLRAWETYGSMPTGLGWFVQNYNGQRVVWHFGLARDAYSALYIKVPARDIALILLANSDALAAPYNLADGNLTSSLFAQLFLKLFVS